MKVNIVSKLIATVSTGLLVGTLAYIGLSDSDKDNLKNIADKLIEQTIVTGEANDRIKEANSEIERLDILATSNMDKIDVLKQENEQLRQEIETAENTDTSELEAKLEANRLYVQQLESDIQKANMDIKYVQSWIDETLNRHGNLVGERKIPVSVQELQEVRNTIN